MKNERMDISRHVWETKYRNAERGMAEHSIADTDALLAPWRPSNLSMHKAGKNASSSFADFRFLPGG
jgi:hypothetical protein